LAQYSPAEQGQEDGLLQILLMHIPLGQSLLLLHIVVHSPRLQTWSAVQLLHFGFFMPHASDSLHALQKPLLQTIPGGHSEMQTISYPTQIPFSHFCPGKQ